MTNESTGADQRHLPRTPLSNIAYNEYKRSTFVRMTQVQAGLLAEILVPANPNRVSLILVNNSPTPVYIGFNPDTSATFGILVAANGGNFSMTLRHEGEAVTTEVYGMSTVAARNCTMIESILQEQ